jgi:hypothetical protein
MADALTCPDCGKEIESADDLEEGEEVTEIEIENGTVSPYRDRTGDLFLCGGCKRPLGFDRH